MNRTAAGLICATIFAASTALATPSAVAAPETQCPPSLSCEWIPAAYRLLGNGKDPLRYGHYDLAHRTPTSRNQRQPPIRYIIIHDTESSYQTTVAEVRNPAWPASWNYTIRSADGHIAQHVRLEDVSWNSGNWYINTQAIGIEHEGYAAAPDGWYTEAMYESSARLVRYLARRYHIPLDRAHILGHDDVPSPTPDKVLVMHRDPGPYWDWAHYFDLLGAPLTLTGRKPARSHPRRTIHRWRSGLGAVLISPRYLRNVLTFTGCTAVGRPCPPHGSSELVLHTRPSVGAPLLPDAGLHPDGSPSTMGVLDQGARVSTGQRFAVAGRRGHWIAIWYQGQQGWLADPPGAPTVTWSPTALVTPKAGLCSIPVYGWGYPEPGAYPAGRTAEPIVPLQYRLPARQWYTVAGTERSMFYQAKSYDGSVPGDRTLVRGHRRYVTIQFGHRLAFVDAADVTIRLPGTHPERTQSPQTARAGPALSR